MINALDTILSQRPKALDGIGVAVANHIDFICMGNGRMIEAKGRKAFINRIFVCKNLCALLNIGDNHRNNRLTDGIFNLADFQHTVSLNHSDHRGFTFCSTSTLAGFATAEIGFINFDFTIKGRAIFKENRANLLAHSPGCLVGNASFPLDLFSGNTATGLCHEVDHVKPSGQSGTGLVKDGSSSRGNLMPAKLTGIYLAFLDFVKFGFPSAIRAGANFIIIAVVKPFKADIIIGKHSPKTIDCELLHFLFSHFIPSYVLLRYKYCSMKGT